MLLPAGRRSPRPAPSMFGESLFDLQTRRRPSALALAAALLFHLLAGTAFWVRAHRTTAGDGSGLPLTVLLTGSEGLRPALGAEEGRSEAEPPPLIPPGLWPRPAVTSFPPAEAVPEGEAEGVPAGSTGETGTALPAGGDISAPRVLDRVIPPYPEDARLSGRQGQVVVEMVIDEEGRASGARVVNGLSETLDAAALEAVAAWRFKPATRNGEPVRVLFRVTVEFRL